MFTERGPHVQLRCCRVPVRMYHNTQLMIAGIKSVNQFIKAAVNPQAAVQGNNNFVICVSPGIPADIHHLVKRASCHSEIMYHPPCLTFEVWIICDEQIGCTL